MKLSIIIVSWKVREKLKENLQAIYASDFPMDNLEIFVVDNNSDDGTDEMLKTDFSKVNLIANKENLGFAKANNQALEQANGEYFLLLNPDMLVRKNTLKNMSEWMDTNQQARLAGCRLASGDGSFVRHVRRFPGFFDQLAIVLKLPHVFPGVLNKYLRKDFDYTQASQVDSIRGGFFFVRRAGKILFRFDERYFLWFEEVDFCKQIKEAGEEVWFTPVAECVDFVGQSFKQVKVSQKQKYFRDSMLKYFQKWHPAWQVYVLEIAWFFGGMIARAAERLKVSGKGST